MKGKTLKELWEELILTHNLYMMSGKTYRRPFQNAYNAYHKKLREILGDFRDGSE